MTSPAIPSPDIVNISKPPLPIGWTEHVAPGGIPYYYNSVTKESTYVRPLPTFTTMQPIPPGPEKKEKPKSKTPIPGTPWLRVITTLGNTFYTNTDRKESFWSVPDEIKEAVALLEEAEKKQVEDQELEKQKAEERREQEAEAELERIKKELEMDSAKRKAEEPELLDEVIVTKRMRVEDEISEEGQSDSDEEEDWQREAAAQLAAEAEAEERKKRDEEEAVKREKEKEEELKRKEKERGKPILNMPNRVDLSIEEAKALFKTLLREKDINPLLPWDTALPKFVSDPRYVLLPSVSARRDAFDEYCRERARELRQAKLSVAADSISKEKSDPRAEFEQLLHEEVKSTRTSWTEWRRTWKKDRRFYNWGRDDRERERRFRDWLKELGEEKRKAAQKAEIDFFALLKEKGNVYQGASWKVVKRGLEKDPRYDAVGSSTLREELFNSYVSRSIDVRHPKSSSPRSMEETDTERKRKDKDRKERAVREREEQVRRERSRIESEMARSRTALSREEGELEFMTLLTDAIREPMATWDSSLGQLKTDSRYLNSSLPDSYLQTIFNRHIDSLRSKYLDALHTLFAAHAPQLFTEFEQLSRASIRSSLPAQKLGLDTNMDPDAQKLEKEYNRWRAARRERAVREFQEMLDENSFVEFWGRIRKMGVTNNGDMQVEIDDEDLEGENGGDRGKIDLKALAKSVNVQEIERVLKNDKRYTIFDHIPEEREKWIRAHIEKLAAPKLSVHVPESSH